MRQAGAWRAEGASNRVDGVGDRFRHQFRFRDRRAVTVGARRPGPPAAARQPRDNRDRQQHSEADTTSRKRQDQTSSFLSPCIIEFVLLTFLSSSVAALRQGRDHDALQIVGNRNHSCGGLSVPRQDLFHTIDRYCFQALTPGVRLHRVAQLLGGRDPDQYRLASPPPALQRFLRVIVTRRVLRCRRAGVWSACIELAYRAAGC